MVTFPRSIHAIGAIPGYSFWNISSEIFPRVRNKYFFFVKKLLTLYEYPGILRLLKISKGGKE
nr:MAG TPA: hypothetical protein [Caudoviricetes sp.]